MTDFNIRKEFELNGSFYHVEFLHNVPELIDECCNLINIEWKRSHTARMRSIEGSCENFPMSLILIKKSKKPEIVGHCKISRLSLSRTKVFVETVVIHPHLRGKGLGKLLMNAAEEVCKRKQMKWIYLATKGQEGFYEKLGYNECSPVSIYGCQFNDSVEDINEIEKQIQPLRNTLFNDQSNNSLIIPPPPPMPQMFIETVVSNVPCTKTFMKKELILNKY